MPNECWNTVSIGADETTIQYLFETECNFETILPFPEDAPLGKHDWAWDHWGVKWNRCDYNVEQKGDQGLDRQTFKTGTSGAQFCMICRP